MKDDQTEAGINARLRHLAEEVRNLRREMESRRGGRLPKAASDDHPPKPPSRSPKKQ